AHRAELSASRPRIVVAAVVGREHALRLRQGVVHGLVDAARARTPPPRDVGRRASPAPQGAVLRTPVASLSRLRASRLDESQPPSRPPLARAPRPAYDVRLGRLREAGRWLLARIRRIPRAGRACFL